MDYIEQLKKYIEENISLKLYFDEYSKIYTMTTENIYGFLQSYDLTNKKVLSVAASGDQRLNAYLMGAKEVTLFDINPLTKHHIELKDEAIKKINFEKFIKFFGINSKKYGNYYDFLDSRIYKEFCNNLSIETQSIFAYIINNNIPCNSIYYYFDNNLTKMQIANNYLKKDNYDSLKKILNTKKINFIHSNILNLKEKLGNERYDMILLSNISDYIQLVYEDNQLKNYRELIDSLIDNLNIGGTIQVGYIYSMYDLHSYKSQFSLNDIRNSYFPPCTFDTTFVEALDGLNTFAYDKVITYTRKK